MNHQQYGPLYSTGILKNDRWWSQVQETAMIRSDPWQACGTKKNGAMANKGSVNSMIYSTRTRWNMLKSKDTKNHTKFKNLRAVDIKIFQDTYCKDIIKDVLNDFGDLEYQSEALKPSNTDRRRIFFQCGFYLSKSKPCRPLNFKLRNQEFKIYIYSMYI